MCINPRPPIEDNEARANDSSELLVKIFPRAGLAKPDQTIQKIES